MGTHFLKVRDLRSCQFRYLQGYMGTKHQAREAVFHETFRYLQGYMGTPRKDGDFCEHDVFRYLQGYMGTIPLSLLYSFPPSSLDTFKDIWELPPTYCRLSSTPFRYLQGYMGTRSLCSRREDVERRLDTFKDIWEHARFMEIIEVISSLDTFKDIWELRASSHTLRTSF